MKITYDLAYLIDNLPEDLPKEISTPFNVYQMNKKKKQEQPFKMAFNPKRLDEVDLDKIIAEIKSNQEFIKKVTRPMPLWKWFAPFTKKAK